MSEYNRPPNGHGEINELQNKDFFSVKRTRSELSSGSSVASVCVSKKVKTDSDAFEMDSLINESVSEENDEVMETTEGTELIKSMSQSMNKKLESLFLNFQKCANEEMQNTLQKYEKMISVVEKDINKLKERSNSLIQLVEKERKTAVSAERKVQTLQLKVTDLEKQMVKSEQYSRKSNVRIGGMVEKKDGICKEMVVEMIQRKLGVNITTKDIDAAHRLPQQDRNKPHPIIVRFFARDIKFQVIKNRSKLKGSGITIQEDLCKAMHLLLNRVSKDERVKTAWAWNGNVFCEDKQGKVVKAEYGEPLNL
jgi:hypothetical protein